MFSLAVVKHFNVLVGKCFIAILAKLALPPTHSGPVRVPIHLRSAFQHGKNDWPGIVSQDTHKKGRCPVAEYRCECQELMLFDACTIDKIKAASAIETIRGLKREIVER
jgi:hypothetical protein